MAPLPLYTLRGHTDSVTALCCGHASDDAGGGGAVLFTGSAAGEVFEWNLRTRRVRRSALAPGGLVRLLLLDGERMLLGQTKEGALCVWDWSDGAATAQAGAIGGSVPKPLVMFDMGTHTFCKCDVLRQRGWIAGAADNDAVSLYRMTDFGLVKTLAFDANNTTASSSSGGGSAGSLKTGSAMSLAFALIDDVALLAVGYESGHVAVWDADAAVCLCHAKQLDEPVLACVFDATTHSIVAGGASTRVVVSCLTAAKDALTLLKQFELPSAASAAAAARGSAGVNAFALRHDRRRLVAACWSGAVEVYAFKKLALHSERVGVSKLKGVNDVCFLTPPPPPPPPEQQPDTGESSSAGAKRVGSDNLLAAASSDGLVTVWKV